MENLPTIFVPIFMIWFFAVFVGWFFFYEGEVVLATAVFAIATVASVLILIIREMIVRPPES